MQIIASAASAHLSTSFHSLSNNKLGSCAITTIKTTDEPNCHSLEQTVPNAGLGGAMRAGDNRLLVYCLTCKFVSQQAIYQRKIASHHRFSNCHCIATMVAKTSGNDAPQ